MFSPTYKLSLAKFSDRLTDSNLVKASKEVVNGSKDKYSYDTDMHRNDFIICPMQ